MAYEIHLAMTVLARNVIVVHCTLKFVMYTVDVGSGVSLCDVKPNYMHSVYWACPG